MHVLSFKLALSSSFRARSPCSCFCSYVYKSFGMFSRKCDYRNSDELSDEDLQRRDSTSSNSIMINTGPAYVSMAACFCGGQLILSRQRAEKEKRDRRRREKTREKGWTRNGESVVDKVGREEESNGDIGLFYLWSRLHGEYE